MVLRNKKTRKSAEKLDEALKEAGYEGRPINFGCSTLLKDYGDVINTPDSIKISVNKWEALKAMEELGVPTPLVSEYEAIQYLNSGIPVVGRKTFHSKGRGFWLLKYAHRLERAKGLGCTHFLKFIEEPREFRVHIVNGQSIKVSEKIRPEGVIKATHDLGVIFQFPEDFAKRKSLRTIAKQAIAALHLDFGAVDILFKDDRFYVLEVNSAPSLTDENSDTLERYVAAFLNLAENSQ